LGPTTPKSVRGPESRSLRSTSTSRSRSRPESRRSSTSRRRWARRRARDPHRWPRAVLGTVRAAAHHPRGL